VQDLTRLHRAEEAVRLLSYTDAATGLPNRRQLAEQLATALADENRVAATGVVAFRVHNLDALAQAEGLEAANEIVKRVAGRIELELGNASESGAVPWRTASAAVCRTAEAELALLLRSRMSAEHLAAVACAMLQSLAARAAEDRSGYSPAISAGIALAAADGLVAEQVLEQAHVAAEQATSPWRCETYSPVTLARSRRRLQVESALRGALERGEFSIAFQPRVATGSYELTGVECLARWENPELGAVPAEEFIPAAEGTGLLVELGGWVIGEACRQVAAWRAQFEREFVASVNIGAAQLADRGLVDRVKGVLETHGLPANALELELSESCTADAPPQAIESLAQLRRLGVRIAIDNLGTGYSSLTRVRRLQFDCMKLDRSLVADLYTDLGAQGVTTAVIAMARSLRVRSVAEGVEDSATLEMLAALGCDEVQGQYIAPPLAPREFAAWVEDGGATALEQRGTLEMIDALEAVERRSRNTGG
jgi:EAL domain-containing protein (putative c-di-GMP-specific phosphodiesterase class I)/GGDEF domain-containing protein